MQRLCQWHVAVETMTGSQWCVIVETVPMACNQILSVVCKGRDWQQFVAVEIVPMTCNCRDGPNDMYLQR